MSRRLNGARQSLIKKIGGGKGGSKEKLSVMDSAGKSEVAEMDNSNGAALRQWWEKT